MGKEYLFYFKRLPNTRLYFLQACICNLRLPVITNSLWPVCWNKNRLVSWEVSFSVQLFPPWHKVHSPLINLLLPLFMNDTPGSWNSSNLRQRLIRLLELAVHPFPVEVYSLRLVVTDLHPNSIAHGCEPQQYSLEDLFWWGQQDHIICKSSDAVQKTSHPLAAPLPLQVRNRIRENQITGIVNWMTLCRGSGIPWYPQSSTEYFWVLNVYKTYKVHVKLWRLLTLTQKWWLGIAPGLPCPRSGPWWWSRWAARSACWTPPRWLCDCRGWTRS